MTPKEEAGIIDMSREEAEMLFDATVRRYLGVSGDEFRAMVAQGRELPDHPMVGHLLLLLGAGSHSQ